jgi:hypothetical protein
MRLDGVPEKALIDGWARTYSSTLSVEIVDGAEFHFCPQYQMDSRNGLPLWRWDPISGTWLPDHNYSAPDSIRTRMPTAGDRVGAFPLVGSPISR